MATVLAATSLAVTALTGCSSGLPAQASRAPVLKVATGVWALGAVVVEIGGAKVSVDDIVPQGRDPLSFNPLASPENGLQGAGLVVLAGGGLQPAVDAAATGSAHVLRLAAVTGSPDPYVWLDPAAMQKAVGAIASAMAAANPPAAPLYQRNATGLRSEIGSLDIDYSSILSTCRATTMVTPDGALSDMAAHYGLADLVAAPTVTAPVVGSLKSRLTGARGGAAFTEPWVDDSGVEQVSAAAGIRTHAVDTLVAAPSAGTPAQDTYLGRMEQNLGTLSGALGCESGNQ